MTATCVPGVLVWIGCHLSMLLHTLRYKRRNHSAVIIRGGDIAETAAMNGQQCVADGIGWLQPYPHLGWVEQWVLNEFLDVWSTICSSHPTVHRIFASTSWWQRQR